MKIIFTIINILLLSFMAYFCVHIFYKNMIPENYILPDSHLKNTAATDLTHSKQMIDKNHHQIIIKRNLFGVEIEEKKGFLAKEITENKIPEELEPTTLNLRLWGTATGNFEVYAVIEDKKIRQQALYQIGDSIQQATIKEIMRNKVVLFYQGKNQVLEMEADNNNVQRTGPFSKLAIPRAIPDSVASEVPVTPDDSTDNNNLMMGQIKFRPHFTEGNPDGLMVYGIKSSSVFRKIGLRNGDIVKDVNGEPIVSGEDASRLFAQIQEEENSHLTVFRRGKLTELHYEVKDGQYSIADHPEDEITDDNLPEEEPEAPPELKNMTALPEDKDKGDE